MNILAFDTCFDACSVAVGVDIGGPAQRIEAQYEPRLKGHAEALMPMMQSAMARAGIGMGELDRIAVTRGPGTFTGTRISVAAARALALATGAPVVATTSLAVLAAEAGRRLAGGLGDALIAVTVDARRGCVYLQLFDAGGTQPLGDAELASVSMAANVAATRAVVYVGSAAEVVAAEARAKGREARAQLPGLLPDAAMLVLMAPRMAPLARPPTPLYLRPPDAKPQVGLSIERAP